MSNYLEVRCQRGDVVETVHHVSVAVVDSSGRLVAAAGKPDHTTFMRSAAKPFQALPLIKDGAVEAFDVSAEELALACASHNSEQGQLELVRAWLERIGRDETDLVCRGHRSLYRHYGGHWIPGAELNDVILAPKSPLSSNCSGKHTGMITLALHHGWPVEGYQRADHPVQQRMCHELAEWAGLEPHHLDSAQDGCGVQSFALPLKSMALAYAKLVSDDTGPGLTIVDAMVQNPHLVAGQRRLCTELMKVYSPRIVVKVGAAGIYCVGIRDHGVGIALKVHDGDAMATTAVLPLVLEELGYISDPNETLRAFARPPLLNTRREVVGFYQAHGEIEKL